MREFGDEKNKNRECYRRAVLHFLLSAFIRGALVCFLGAESASIRSFHGLLNIRGDAFLVKVCK